MTRDAFTELRDVALGAADAGGYFPAMYARVTDHIADSVESGHWADPDRMDRFASAFAGYYTRPRQGEGAVPRCWQAAWDVAGDGGLLIVQHLLLGMNAHINHDLPQVVVELADETGDLESIRPDFDAVNDVLGAATTGILDDLDRVSRWTNELAAVGGGRLFHFSLRRARAQAWAAAVRMYGLDTAGRAAYVADLDDLVSVLTYLVTRPVFPAALLVPVGRLFEERDPLKVTRALLGEHAPALG